MRNSHRTVTSGAKSANPGTIEELEVEVDRHQSSMPLLPSNDGLLTYSIAAHWELPFDRQYHDCPINCNLRTLTVESRYGSETCCYEGCWVRRKLPEPSRCTAISAAQDPR